MHVLRASAVVALLALWVPQAAAQDSDPAPDFERNGAYLALAGTYAIQDFDSGSASFDDTLGFNFRLGYRMHPRFSLEGQFEYLPEFSGTNPSPPSNLQLEVWATTLNGKVFLLKQRYQPFLLFGGGIAYADLTGAAGSNSELKVAGRLGGGIDIYATEQIAVTLDASYLIPASDFPYFSFSWGVQYRF